jgi:hypothetical protein
MNNDLQDLVDNPKETLEVEAKAHLDLVNDKVHRARLARHLCALANHGGGYLVVGFDDDLKEQGAPPDVEDLYHRDKVSNVVGTYLQPPFLCDVAFVKSASGVVHPVIRVPSHGIAPVAAKIDGPMVGGKPEGVQSGRIYIRKVTPNGPSSEPITLPEDWPPLIRRCTLADKEGLYTALRDVLEVPKAGQGTVDLLGEWHDAAKLRYNDLLKEYDPEWMVPLARNHYIMSYVIRGSSITPLSMAELMSAAQQANAGVRQVVWTGWSMFYLFSRSEIAPYTYYDPKLQEDVLETNLMVERKLIDTLPDFWRLAPGGKASLCRAYREDRPVEPAEGGKRKPGGMFSLRLLAQELAEIMAHAHALAQHFPDAETVAFKMEWFGLKDRVVWDREASYSVERKARSDGRVLSFEVLVSDLAARWPELVAEKATKVAHLFDPTLELNADWVRRVSKTFRQL